MSAHPPSHSNSETWRSARRLVGLLLREARRDAAVLLDWYAQNADVVADFQLRIAATALEPGASIGSAWADLWRELAYAGTTAGRALLKV